MEIRAAEPGDLRAIQAVFESHVPEYDWEVAERYFRSYFSDPGSHAGEVALVGVSGGRVAGVIGYLPDRRGAPGIYWLGWYYVHSQESGRGLGRRMLDHVVRELRARGARKLYTDTSSWKFYDRAHHRYRALGFVEEGTLRDYYEDGEHQVIYAMDLGEAAPGAAQMTGSIQPRGTEQP